MYIYIKQLSISLFFIEKNRRSKIYDVALIYKIAYFNMTT